MVLMLLLTIGVGVRGPAAHFDVIEVNHFYAWSGGSVRCYDQVLFKDWVPADREFIVHGWLSMRGCRVEDAAAEAEWAKAMGLDIPGLYANHPWPKFYGKFVPDERVPMFDGRVYRGRYVVGGRSVEITADSFLETHTTYDPERRNLRIYPNGVRLGVLKNREPLPGEWSER